MANVNTVKGLKKLYLEFFESKQHKVINSASLIPENDPTVLFTTAGMHPLVPFLVGEPHPLGKRLTDFQKCIRTGDIDEVGDATHLTCFEMLGNWSLGDYFKKESITWSWEFLTSKDWLALDKERLGVTVFEGDNDAPRDEEAAQIWKDAGVNDNKIAYLDKSENWWGPAGETGPCGPDTEIYYWKYDEKPVPAKFDIENEGWVEIWNNVFMQYNKTKEGKFEPLEQVNVDTGLGAERVAMILQGQESVYGIEVFKPSFELIKGISGKDLDENTENSFRVIADHIRSSAFILGDEREVRPSNMDQGYILRRFIRRAIRHAKLLGIEESFCSKIAESFIEFYHEDYPTMLDKKDFILSELDKEESKFNNTIQNGLKKIQQYMRKLGLQGLSVDEIKAIVKDTEKILERVRGNQFIIDSKWVFDMFQSHGMPYEMTLEEIKTTYEVKITDEEKLLYDVKKQYKEHQEKSRAGAEQKFKGGLVDNSEMTTALHTVTHILNQALRKVLDPSIKQKGSNITAERLRFDFNFDRKLTPEEKLAIEDEVNRVINQNIEVERIETSPEEAIKMGAQAEFGTRYPEKVSVYKIADYAIEICMGPHVKNTSEIGKFKIKKEESSASGIRRIKGIIVQE